MSPPPPLPLPPSTSQPQSFFSMACAAVNGVINMVTSPSKALEAGATSHQGGNMIGQVEGEGQGGAQIDSFMCSCCLLVSNHVTYKCEHPQKSGRGVCRASKDTSKVVLQSLKMAAQNAMHAKNHVRRPDAKHFSCPEYLLVLPCKVSVLCLVLIFIFPFQLFCCYLFQCIFHYHAGMTTQNITSLHGAMILGSLK